VNNFIIIKASEEATNKTQEPDRGEENSDAFFLCDLNFYSNYKQHEKPLVNRLFSILLRASLTMHGTPWSDGMGPSQPFSRPYSCPLS
jgi:hypothetical protein